MSLGTIVITFPVIFAIVGSGGFVLFVILVQSRRKQLSHVCNPVDIQRSVYFFPCLEATHTIMNANERKDKKRVL